MAGIRSTDRTPRLVTDRYVGTTQAPYGYAYSGYVDDADVQLKRQVGKGMRAALEAAGMTQRQLAELVGFPQGKISHYENGQYLVPLEKIFAVDRAVGQPGGYVFRLAGLVEDTTDWRSLIMADGRIPGDVRAAVVTIIDSAIGAEAPNPIETVTAELASASAKAPSRRRRPGPARSA